jgi:hypothetical protein
MDARDVTAARGHVEAGAEAIGQELHGVATWRQGLQRPIWAWRRDGHPIFPDLHRIRTVVHIRRRLQPPRRIQLHLVEIVTTDPKPLVHETLAVRRYVGHHGPAHHVGHLMMAIAAALQRIDVVDAAAIADVVQVGPIGTEHRPDVEGPVIRDPLGVPGFHVDDPDVAVSALGPGRDRDDLAIGRPRRRRDLIEAALSFPQDAMGRVRAERHDREAAPRLAIDHER